MTIHSYPRSHGEKTLQLGVIGCGHWGPNHIRVFNSMAESCVVAAADCDPARLNRIQQLYPQIRCTMKHSDLLENPQIEALVICTPTATHYRLVYEALAAGKHVFCEKPLCLTADEAQELTALAAARARVLMVGHVFLFNAGIMKLKELVASGELGELRYLSATRTSLGPIRSDVNAAYDLAAHDVAVFNWLLDQEPELVSAVGASFLQPGIEDVVVITLRYPGKVLGTIQASWLNPQKVRQLTVVGSRKMATWDDLNLSAPVAVYEKGVLANAEVSDYGEFLRLSMWDGDVRLPKVHLEEPLKTQATAFVEAVQTGRPLRSDGAFATGVVNVLENIASSLKLQGHPVPDQIPAQTSVAC